MHVCHTFVKFIYLFAARQARANYVTLPNNAIMINNYNCKATLMMKNINIYWTVHYAPNYLMNFKHI